MEGWCRPEVNNEGLEEEEEEEGETGMEEGVLLGAPTADMRDVLVVVVLVVVDLVSPSLSAVSGRKPPSPVAAAATSPL